MPRRLPTSIGYASTLTELLVALRGPAGDELTDNQWCELPTFGGTEPRDTQGVWSWDETHLLVGDGRAELRILPREGW